jgi:hypothetical protein
MNASAVDDVVAWTVRAVPGFHGLCVALGVAMDGKTPSSVFALCRVQILGLVLAIARGSGTISVLWTVLSVIAYMIGV